MSCVVKFYSKTITQISKIQFSDLLGLSDTLQVNLRVSDCLLLARSDAASPHNYGTLGTVAKPFLGADYFCVSDATNDAQLSPR